MKAIPCSPANSILEVDLELAATHGIIRKLSIMETPVGFYVSVQFFDKKYVLDRYRYQFSAFLEWPLVVQQLLSEPGKEWYLTTRRDRESPKIFKDLNRLNDHLKEFYPTDSFELFRNSEVPGKPKTKGLKGTAK
ncbi:hypothetical protein ALQ30_200603 [Pseudomonas syringae pv. persicae]|uniref:Uncharacterized protein n=2 Tax=Pseudomonas syringae group genomosp. 3 TaxID=251701 RepID=A0A3M4AHF2_9PSED|nr:hypothetical protein [Pseudomonas syringae]QOQ33527.1 hypothetical protein [Pseudomonas syringae pv. actinidiae]RMP06152.1 hypothetical protein ALQ30_200603 [Pseudomonas syringae pv. persicae]